MNVAFFLLPSVNVKTLYVESSLRQGLEKMRYHGYTSIPVVTKDNKYVGTISEGDFLWYLIDNEEGQLHRESMKDIEDSTILDVLNLDKNPPVRITANIDQLIQRSLQQSFIPVIDDLGTFVGIVTRKRIIEYCASLSSNGEEMQEKSRLLI